MTIYPFQLIKNIDKSWMISQYLSFCNFTDRSLEIWMTTGRCGEKINISILILARDINLHPCYEDNEDSLFSLSKEKNFLDPLLVSVKKNLFSIFFKHTINILNSKIK